MEISKNIELSNQYVQPNIDLPKIISAQRTFFNEGATLSYEFRVAQLQKLYDLFLQYKEEILHLFDKDTRKSDFENYFSEYQMILSEIRFILKHLKQFMKKTRVKTPLLSKPSKGYIISEPLGVVLIISTWNAPVNLTFMPLIGAIAAGNCAIIKPSELAPTAEQFIIKLINKNFAPNFLYAVAGGATEIGSILQQRYDLIFFTGSTEKAKFILHAAAEHITPTILELGGKSPCVVSDKVNIPFVAEKIVLGKYTNTGQICIAIDYLLVHEHIVDALLQQIVRTIHNFYGTDIKKSKDYGRIINKTHFMRLTRLLEGQTLYFGGETDEQERYIEPTIIKLSNADNKLMSEEIFGPILPVFVYKDLNEAVDFIKQYEKPLAAYFFSKENKEIVHLCHRLSYGGGCVNDVIKHYFIRSLPFGGVAHSGFGKYHGEESFNIFSNKKAIFHSSWQCRLDPIVPPHGRFKRLKEYLMRLFLD